MDETFPDLGSLTDVELKDVIRQLTEEETEISYKRRILHGKIDILRAELVNRLRHKHDDGEITITGEDVQRLTDILASASRGRCEARADERSERRGGPRRSAMALHCTECGFVNGEGANYCQRCGALLQRGEVGGASRSRPRTASTRPASSCPVEIGRGHRARPRARDPRRRRARGGELRGRGRAHEHRPPTRLRGVPRRRHRLARPRAADPPRRGLVPGRLRLAERHLREPLADRVPPSARRATRCRSASTSSPSTRADGRPRDTRRGEPAERARGRARGGRRHQRPARARQAPEVAHDRRGLQGARAGVPGHLDLEDPLPRGPEAADAAAHSRRLPPLHAGRRRAAAHDPAHAARRVPAAARDPPGAGRGPLRRGRARRGAGRHARGRAHVALRA